METFARFLYQFDDAYPLSSKRRSMKVREVLEELLLVSDVVGVILEYLSPIFTYDDLTDAQAMKRRHPDTFGAPSLGEIEKITTGCSIKISHASCRYFVDVERVLPSLDGNPWDRRLRFVRDVPIELREDDMEICPACSTDDQEKSDELSCNCDDLQPMHAGWVEVKARHCYDTSCSDDTHD